MTRHSKILLALALFVLAGCAPISQAAPERKQRIESSPNHRDGAFTNPNGVVLDFYSTDLLAAVWNYYFASRVDPEPAGEIPVVPIRAEEWTSGSRSNEGDGELAFAWLGHAGLLIVLDGVSILVDPVFEDRASPYSWTGPKRFHPPPVTVANLPPVQIVLITHDHLDHLEEKTMIALAGRVASYVVPLGVGELLENWGIPAEKIVELDWWESHDFGPLRFHSTPAVHYSKRGMFDMNERLWSSWAVVGQSRRFFVSGDSGYFDGFKRIGSALGPFDVSFLKIGAYTEGYTQVHMLPEEALREHADLQGGLLMPIHWATFDLALHSWYEPIERLLTAAESGRVQVVTPLVGQRITLERIPETGPWWRKVQEPKPEPEG